LAKAHNVDVLTASGHTLFELSMLRKAAGAKSPTTFAAFQKLIGPLKVGWFFVPLFFLLLLLLLLLLRLLFFISLLVSLSSSSSCFRLPPGFVV
jgi:hypothetical protein